MWLDSKAVNCPQKWGNFIISRINDSVRESLMIPFVVKVLSELSPGPTQ